MAIKAPQIKEFAARIAQGETIQYNGNEMNRLVHLAMVAEGEGFPGDFDKAVETGKCVQKKAVKAVPSDEVEIPEEDEKPAPETPAE